MTSRKHPLSARLLCRITLILLAAFMVFPENATAYAAGNPPLNIDESIATGELARYVDDTFAKAMNEYSIPGAVIAIVKDGKTVLLKGYGCADSERKQPIDPAKTLFRIGSITKLFTATAVMQLAEAGKVKLEEDVNRYLDGFTVKNSYKTPVTVAQLLTHTSGIDSDIIGDLSKTPSGMRSVTEFLRRRMLPVVREPGRYIQYSSYGTALAGSVVESVSGAICSDYVEKNIFAPLGMEDTTFSFNPEGLAQGYVCTGKAPEARELGGYFNLYPEGGISSTAADMAKFMIAHLNLGEYEGRRILEESTAADMQRRHASFDALLPGTCYGFYETVRSGRRAIGHGGYSPDGFSSELRLFDDGMGIFISVNQGYNNAFPQDFMDSMIDCYFAPSEQSTPAAAKAVYADKGVAGLYRFGEYTRSTLIKGDVFGNGDDVKVKVNGDGTITLDEVDAFTRKKTTDTAQPVSPLIFRRSNGDYVVFEKDAGGRVNYMAQTSDSWHGTYERISWVYENNAQSWLFAGLMGLALIETLVWAAYGLRRLIRRKTRTPETKTVRISWLLTGLSSALNLAFFSVSMMTWGERLRYGIPPDAVALLTLPIATGLMTAVLAALTVLHWKNRNGGLFFRLNATLVTAAGGLFIWLYDYYNLLGFRF